MTDAVRQGRSRVVAGLVFVIGVGLPAYASAADASTPSSAMGQPVGGLVVTLASSAARWRVGTAMTFEATLRNVGSRPFRIDLFGDLQALYEGKHRGSYVSSCWALAWEPRALARGPRRGRYTLEVNQFRLLTPGESYRHPLSLTLSAIAPATYRIRLAYVPRAATPTFSFPDDWERQHRLTDPMWIGMAWSNPVTIEVVD